MAQINSFSNPTYFNNDVTFYKDITIGGGLKLDELKLDELTVKNLFVENFLNAGAAGLYIGDGFLAFENTLNNSNGYYITTSVNALNAGPVTLNSTMTIDGTWVIV